MATTRTHMTVEEFQRLPESSQRQELIHGELITDEDNSVSPAPKDAHQRAYTYLIIALGQRLKVGELRAAPTDVYLTDEIIVQPDLFWVSGTDSQCTLKEDGYWHGAPDLVVEVLSPATQARDRGVKFQLYERYGVREYWLVEPVSLFIEVFTLKAGRFERVGLFEAGQSFASPLFPEQEFDVSAILGVQK